MEVGVMVRIQDHGSGFKFGTAGVSFQGCLKVGKLD